MVPPAACQGGPTRSRRRESSRTWSWRRSGRRTAANGNCCPAPCPAAIESSDTRRSCRAAVDARPWRVSKIVTPPPPPSPHDPNMTLASFTRALAAQHRLQQGAPASALEGPQGGVQGPARGAQEERVERPRGRDTPQRRGAGLFHARRRAPPPRFPLRPRRRPTTPRARARRRRPCGSLGLGPVPGPRVVGRVRGESAGRRALGYGSSPPSGTPFSGSARRSARGASGASSRLRLLAKAEGVWDEAQGSARPARVLARPALRLLRRGAAPAERVRARRRRGPRAPGDGHHGQH